MTDAAERELARAELERTVQPSLSPVLDAQEVEDVLDAARVAAVWEAGKAYSYGERVVPASPKGRFYVCVEPGTSGASEPSFPTYDSGQVTDGGVTWEEAGRFSKLYDARKAIYGALVVKRSKANEFTGADEARITANLDEMLRRYRPVGIA